MRRCLPGALSFPAQQQKSTHVTPNGCFCCTKAVTNTKSQQAVTVADYSAGYSMKQSYFSDRLGGLPVVGGGLGGLGQHHLQSLQELRKSWAKICWENMARFHLGRGTLQPAPTWYVLSVWGSTRELFHQRQELPLSPTCSSCGQLCYAQSSGRQATRVLWQVPFSISHSH